MTVYFITKYNESSFYWSYSLLGFQEFLTKYINTLIVILVYILPAFYLFLQYEKVEDSKYSIIL